MGGDGIPVGHTRHVVGHLGHEVRLRVPVRGWDLLGMPEVVVHEPPDERDRLLVMPALGRTEIDVLEHEVPQLVHHGQGRRVHAHHPGIHGRAHHRSYHAPDPVPPHAPEPVSDGARQVLLAQQPGTHRIQGVVGQVRDAVGVADAHRLLGGGRRLDAPGVGADAIAHLPREVDVLEHLEDAHALGRVVPATARREVGRQRLLARVPEGGVPHVVAEGDGLREGLVERQRRRQRARDLHHLEGVRETRDVVVTLGVDEHLRLVLETTERLGVEDPVAIALECRAQVIGWLGPHATAGVDGAEGCRRQAVQLLGLARLAGPEDERGGGRGMRLECVGGHVRRPV
jgi:hypothetical protein